MTTMMIPRSLRAVAVATAIVALGAAFADAQEPAGVAAAVNPQVTGTPPAAQPRILEVGADVVLNEHIVTGSEGQSQLLFRDGSTVTLGPLADLTIDKFVYTPKTQIAELAITASRGVLRLVGGRASKDEPIIIRTPTSLIGIRGGINYTSVDPETGATETSQAYGTSTSVTSTLSGAQQTITRNDLTITVSREGITITKMNLDRINAMLAGMLGTPSKTAGATTPPNDNSPRARRVASNNSDQPAVALAPPTGPSQTLTAGVNLLQVEHEIAQTAQVLPPGSSASTPSALSGQNVVFGGIDNGTPNASNNFPPFQLPLPGGAIANIGTLSNLQDRGGDSLIQVGRFVGLASSSQSAFFGSFHFVIGVALGTLPTSGTVTYNLLGATHPSFSDGSGSPGVFQGTMGVAFGGSLATTRVGVTGSAAMPGDLTYTFATPGGAGNPGASAITLMAGGTNTNGFAFPAPGSFVGMVPVSQATGRACAGATSCSAYLSGFLGGPNGERLGLVYQIGGPSGSTTPSVIGVAAFKR